MADNDSYNTDVNTTLNVAAPGVQANDFSFYGGSFTSQLVATTSHGTLTFNSDGSFTYVPNVGLHRHRLVHLRRRAGRRDLERRHGDDLGQPQDALRHQHQRQRARLAPPGHDARRPPPTARAPTRSSSSSPGPGRSSSRPPRRCPSSRTRRSSTATARPAPTPTPWPPATTPSSRSRSTARPPAAPTAWSSPAAAAPSRASRSPASTTPS